MARYERELSRTLDCGATPRIDVRTVDGPAEVRGEDRAGVRVTAIVRFRADTDEEADSIMRAVEAGIHGDVGHVYVHSPATEDGALLGPVRHVFGRHRHIEMDVEIVAPRGSSLALRHVNGSVELRGIGGDVTVHMVNGRFEASQIGANLTVHHVNGRAIVRDVGGNIEISHTNGAIDVERARGDVRLQLVNGSADIAEAGGSVAVKGVSGAYTFSGAVHSNVTMSNARGSIILNLPRDSRFQLDAESALGGVTSELSISESETGSGKAPRVKLRSEIGRIELRALREPAPAVV